MNFDIGNESGKERIKVKMRELGKINIESTQWECSVCLLVCVSVCVPVCNKNHLFIILLVTLEIGC